MNKAELIDAIAADAGITKAQAKKALDSFTDNVGNTLKKGDRISLVGFGTFSISKRNARSGRNPQTGAAIQIKAKNVAKFKAGSELDSKVNQSIFNRTKWPLALQGAFLFRGKREGGFGWEVYGFQKKKYPKYVKQNIQNICRIERRSLWQINLKNKNKNGKEGPDVPLGQAVVWEGKPIASQPCTEHYRETKKVIQITVDKRKINAKMLQALIDNCQCDSCHKNRVEEDTLHAATFTNVQIKNHAMAPKTM